VGDGGAAGRQAGQELDQGGGLAADGLQRRARAVGDRLGAGIAAIGQPGQQVQEIGQVLGLGPPLVDGEDEPAGLGLQQEVGVLHPLGDALERHGLSQVVVGQEGGEFVVGDVGIDGHERGDAGVGALVRRSRRRADQGFA
jgi:hypothetical protein